MSIYQALFEKSEGQTDKQKDGQNRAKQKDYTSPALLGLATITNMNSVGTRASNGSTPTCVFL